MIVSGVITLIGLMDLLMKSKSGYILCTYGVAAFFFALKISIEQGKWQISMDNFVKNVIHYFIFYLISASLLFIMMIFILNKKKRSFHL